jgi:hypothetical protein
MFLLMTSNTPTFIANRMDGMTEDQYLNYGSHLISTIETRREKEYSDALRDLIRLCLHPVVATRPSASELVSLTTGGLLEHSDTNRKAGGKRKAPPIPQLQQSQSVLTSPNSHANGGAKNATPGAWNPKNAAAERRERRRQNGFVGDENRQLPRGDPNYRFRAFSRVPPPRNRDERQGKRPRADRGRDSPYAKRKKSIRILSDRIDGVPVIDLSSRASPSPRIGRRAQHRIDRAKFAYWSGSLPDYEDVEDDVKRAQSAKRVVRPASRAKNFIEENGKLVEIIDLLNDSWDGD